MKKYVLTENKMCHDGRTLYQIKALRDFGNVKTGDLGGWIEREKNLSQNGNCWVSGNAKVYGKARVHNNALIFGSAEVYGNAWIFDNAKIHENSSICGDATVCDNAEVFGGAFIAGSTVIFENAKVYGKPRILGEVEISGDANVEDIKDFIVFEKWWDSGEYFTWTRSNNKWRLGCFYGSGEELLGIYENNPKSKKELERIVKYVEDIIKDED